MKSISNHYYIEDGMFDRVFCFDEFREKDFKFLQEQIKELGTCDYFSHEPVYIGSFSVGNLCADIVIAGREREEHEPLRLRMDFYKYVSPENVKNSMIDHSIRPWTEFDEFCSGSYSFHEFGNHCDKILDLDYDVFRRSLINILSELISRSPAATDVADQNDGYWQKNEHVLNNKSSKKKEFKSKNDYKR